MATGYNSPTKSDAQPGNEPTDLYLVCTLRGRLA